MNAVPAVMSRAAAARGQNIIKVVDSIQRTPAQAQGVAAFGSGGRYPDRPHTTIRASVEDVQFTLMLAIALIVMVMFLFRAHLAPR